MQQLLDDICKGTEEILSAIGYSTMPCSVAFWR
jgi:hypothetical protein